MGDTNRAAARHREELEALHRGKCMLSVSSLVEHLQSIDTDGDGMISVNEMSDPAVEHLIAEMDLPKGFYGWELLQLLDHKGSGKVSYTEFAASMTRLVYSDEFQRRCLNTLNLNIVKRMVKSVEQSLASSTSQLRSELLQCQKDVARLLAEVSPRLQQCPDLAALSEMANPPSAPAKSSRMHFKPTECKLPSGGFMVGTPVNPDDTHKPKEPQSIAEKDVDPYRTPTVTDAQERLVTNLSGGLDAALGDCAPSLHGRAPVIPPKIPPTACTGDGKSVMEG